MIQNKLLKLFLVLIIFFEKNNFSIRNVINSNIKEKNIIKKIDNYCIIFIHGTFEIKYFMAEVFRSLFSFNFFKNLYEIKNNYLKNKICITCRKKRWNRDIQEIQYLFGKKKGMNLISKYSEDISKYGKATLSIFRNVFNYSILNNKKNFKLTTYLFNWDGILSESNRKDDSSLLFNELKNIKSKNEKRDQNTIFILIGYSHGGNVALHLADFINEKDNLNIDYLILLGTPIYENIHKIFKKNNNQEYFFKNVINIFSKKDKLQNYDAISHNSKNWFTKRSIIELTTDKRSNLYEFEWTYLNKNFKEKEKLNNNLFIKNLLYYNKKENHLYFPTHQELVYFRNIDYPPTILFIPFILKFINDFKSKAIENNFFKIIFSGDTNRLFLYQKIKEGKNINNYSFINLFNTNNLKNLYDDIMKKNKIKK